VRHELTARARRAYAAAGAAVSREFYTLVLVLLAAAALWGFLELAGEVAEGDTRAADRALLLALRNPSNPADPVGPAWLEEAMRDFTALGSIGVLSFISLGVAGYLALQRRYRALLLLLAAVAGGMVLSSLLKAGFDRPRPDLVPHGARVYTASFPSGHSLLATVVYLTLGALLARLIPDRPTRLFVLALAILLSVLVGVSRVYLGVHWPSDVAAGWMAGSAWALVWWLVARWLQRRHVVEDTEPEPPAR
jgi:undecaprenyl-diphosphatase